MFQISLIHMRIIQSGSVNWINQLIEKIPIKRTIPLWIRHDYFSHEWAEEKLMSLLLHPRYWKTCIIAH